MGKGHHQEAVRALGPSPIGRERGRETRRASGRDGSERLLSARRGPDYTCYQVEKEEAGGAVEAGDRKKQTKGARRADLLGPSARSGLPAIVPGKMLVRGQRGKANGPPADPGGWEMGQPWEEGERELEMILWALVSWREGLWG